MISRNPKTPDSAAPAADSNAPLVGSFSRKVSHGRIQLPPAWSSLAPGDSLYALLWPPAARRENHILVFPPAKWQAMTDHLAAMPPTDPEGIKLKRIIGSSATLILMNAYRKITLPAELLKSVNITSEALLLGQLDTFSIWNPKNYEAQLAADAKLMDQAFTSIQ